VADRCTQCGTLLESSGRGRPRRYCSRSCQARAYRARKARHPAPRRGRPSTLTRARIVAAAVDLADRAGLDAVTMRRIATELGVATMSLYQHFPSKDALVGTMTDTVVGEGRAALEVSGGWRARLEAEAHAEWRLYRRHPWVLETLATTRPPVGPNTLAVIDRALSAAAATGLPARTALPIYLAVSGLVQGLALLPTAEHVAADRTGQSADQWWCRQAETFGELLACGEYPFLAGHFDLADGDEFTDFDALFEFGLTTLLDGLAAKLATAD
jgi:AcrR family transcriptional regulator